VTYPGLLDSKYCVFVAAAVVVVVVIHEYIRIIYIKYVYKMHFVTKYIHLKTIQHLIAQSLHYFIANYYTMKRIDLRNWLNESVMENEIV
jgi:uncharacterized membrane protein